MVIYWRNSIACRGKLIVFVWFQVEVEVETMDKGGNFIGWMFVDGHNLSIALVEEGLAKVHFTAERSNHYKALVLAEERAKNAKKNVRNILVQETLGW